MKKEGAAAIKQDRLKRRPFPCPTKFKWEQKEVGAGENFFS